MPIVFPFVMPITNPMGIDTRTLYDNLGRTIKTIQDYTGNAETADSDVATEYGYDGDNHVISIRADEPGGSYQQTNYDYGVSTSTGSGVDSNDILSAIQYPDPSTGQPSSSQQDSYLVNALGQVVQYTDRNGNVHQYSYDVLGRLTADFVQTLAAGVDGSIRKITYAYDSQGNLSVISSLNGNGVAVNQVQRTFNGLGQLTSETQSHGENNLGYTPVVKYAYNEMANGENNSRLVSITYPNGYVLDYNYSAGLDDSISRLSSLSDTTGTLESYLYLGLNTVVERDHPQTGVNLTYLKQAGDANANSDGGDQYTGLDRFGRVIDQNWIDASTGATVDRYQYGYDQDSDVLYRKNLVDTAMSELYQYDNLNQLVSFQRGTLNSSNDGISGTPSRSQSWTPDALGNFTNVTTDGTSQTRTANQQNEYTSISSQNAPVYDANGNLTADGSGTTYIYDAWNRLVQVSSNGSTIASYSYDGLNRLIQVTGEGPITDLYYSSSDQVLVEYQVGEAMAYNVWSPVYVNALVFRAEYQSGVYVRHYALQDANWNVTAWVNSLGAVLERYAYDPYGAVTVLSANWVVQSGSSLDFPNGSQGMYYDWTTNLYITPSGRVISPSFMRPLQLDPLGQGPDVNPYRWEGDGPTNAVDPSGLEGDKLTQGPYGFLARLTMWWYNDSELDATIEANKHQEFNPDQTNRPGLKMGDRIDREHRGWYNNTLQKFGPTVVGTAFLVGTTFFAGPEDAIVTWLGSKGIRVLWESGRRVLQKAVKGKWTRVAEKDVECLAKEYNAARRAPKKYVRDFPTKATKNWSATFKSEGEARNLVRHKLGKNPVEVEPGKWRSADGKWQYRAKPGDLADKHIHLEELNPETGEVIQNLHLRWPEGGGR
jgi:RHS repeat-associated protein